jgi:hypothetical protein
MTSESLRSALADNRYETARRIGLELVRVPETCTAENIHLLHDALVALADFQSARELLETRQEAFGNDVFQATLKLAEDFHILTGEGHYRLSAEARQGYSIDEYVERCRAHSAKKFQEIKSLSLSPAQEAQLDEALIRCKIKPCTAAQADTTPSPESSGNSGLCGRIFLPDGRPAGNILVTLGLKTEVLHVDPNTFFTHKMHYLPGVGEMKKVVATTADDGDFSFQNIPAGTHDYLAVTLDPETWEIPTRFVARAIDVAPGATLDLGDLHIKDWESAPASVAASPHPDRFEEGDSSWRKIAEWKLHNPFYYAFRRQLVSFALPEGNPPASELRVIVVPGKDELFQISGSELSVMIDLPARSDRAIAVYAGPSVAVPPASALRLVEESGSVWRIDTGSASFRIAGNVPNSAAPILGIKGADEIWRGSGRMVLPAGTTLLRQSTRVLEQGPLWLEVLIEYHLSCGRSYSQKLKAIGGEPYLLVHETSPELEGAAFELSLREFSGGRGFLHWTPEAGGHHWSTLESNEEMIARLPESVPWWIPPQGFGYAMTPGGLREQDYIAVFTIRRGEWIDRKFERLAQGPINRDGTPNHGLDWPFPEMVGSSISMITAHTSADGDAFFRFGMFEGERRWGLLASSLAQNDGPFKDLAAIQHANSSPRLQDFKDWHLDEPDRVVRPNVVIQRGKLTTLRKKTRHPRFARLWEKIRSGRVPGPTQGLAFALGGDPGIAWKKRIELLAISEIRAKMTLLGRDWSDIYSPVGGRPVTQWAEEYDLIAASGVFSPDEERQMRAFFILMGHMFMEPDFMNWKFNARNANFEADRTDIVAAVGLVFDGHPDAKKFLDHVVERMHRALGVYCTPGSGKWYENPACYYLHASKCRMNLVYHLATHGHLDVAAIPRLKEFLRWGVLLLTPPQPVSYAVLRDGGEEAYLKAEKIRKIPPIGDHAGLGRWLPEHYFFIGKLFLASDPEFGRELMNAYFLSSGDGARLLENHRGKIEQEGEQLFHAVAAGSSSGNLPLLFTTIEDADIPADPAIVPTSRRLEGFGAVLRNRVNTDSEDYLLLKQGPGGYRYQRTEGSFLLFAEGRPLIYDGGEAGETWRHSTLSFHDVRMPLSAGRVERYFSRPAFQFVQGIHPEIIAPGRPVFLSDSCEHELVEEAYRRFEKAEPAAVRSLAWVGSDYLIVHDALNIDPKIPSHWHLQVVGDAVSGSSGHYEFQGRFGVDLQVVLPGQSFSGELLETVPIFEYQGVPSDWFAMKHLQLTAGTPGGFLAVLKPLSARNPERITAEALGRQGVKVSGRNFTDLHWFNRNGMEYRQGALHFCGQYGARLQREGSTVLWLGGSGKIEDSGISLESSGAMVLAEIRDREIRFHTDGNGSIRWNTRKVEIRGGFGRISSKKCHP